MRMNTNIFVHTKNNYSFYGRSVRYSVCKCRKQSVRIRNKKFLSQQKSISRTNTKTTFRCLKGLV
nr:MAG TPA: hypothetical protein [Caudoviricetes sp.]